MVLVRKRFFRTHCVETLRNSHALKPIRAKTLFRRKTTMPTTSTAAVGLSSSAQAEKGHSGRKRIGARSVEISRPTNGHVVDHFIDDRIDSPVEYVDEPQPVRASSEGRDGSTTAGHTPDTQSAPSPININRPVKSAMVHPGEGTAVDLGQHIHIISSATPASAQYRTRQILRERTFSRTLSIQSTRTADHRPERSASHYYASPMVRGATLTRSMTKPTPTHIPHPQLNMNTGYGGFSYPPYFLPWLLPESWKKAIMNRISTRKNNLTIFTNPTIAPEGITQGGRLVMPGQGINGAIGDPQSVSLGQSARARVAEWMPDRLEGLVVGRNSRFYTEELDEDVIEQLGGVEYKALRLLAWLIPGVSARQSSRVYASRANGK